MTHQTVSLGKYWKLFSATLTWNGISTLAGPNETGEEVDTLTTLNISTNENCTFTKGAVLSFSSFCSGFSYRDRRLCNITRLLCIISDNTEGNESLIERFESKLSKLIRNKTSNYLFALPRRPSPPRLLCRVRVQILRTPLHCDHLNWRFPVR